MLGKKKRKNRDYVPSRLNSFTACISTTMVLILVGIIVFFSMMAESLERSVKENFSVDVLLDDSLAKKEVAMLKKEIENMPYAKKVEYISKEQATRTMAEDFGVDPKEFLGGSPFPASFDVHLDASYTHPDSLSRYMPSLKKVVGVTDVIYPEDLMESVNDNVQKITLILLFIAVLLGVVSVALINNTMRLNIARRRITIQTMKLVGASWGFIRAPFLKQAFWMGFAASIMAGSVMAGGFVVLLRWDPLNASLVTPFIIGMTLGAVLLVGVSLTMLCAFFSVNRHLAMSSDEAAVY